MGNEQAPVSFVVPAYNAATTIEATISSALAGAEAATIECEVVVVDDGSSDDTFEVVHALAGGDDRVQLRRHRANRGGGAARNTAVDHARHAEVFCLDSDNLIDAGSFVRLMEARDEREWDLLAVAEVRNFTGDALEPTFSWIFKADEVQLADVLRAHETPVSSGNYLYTRQAWQDIGGYPEFAGSLDAWGFGFRALCAGKRLAVCPDTFYWHRQGHESYWIRDTDQRRRVAAAQLLFPALDLLDPEDRTYLLDDRGLLEWFERLPDRPLQLHGHAATGASTDIEIVVHPDPATPARPAHGGRVGRAVRRSWTEAPPAVTVHRVRKGFGLVGRRLTQLPDRVLPSRRRAAERDRRNRVAVDDLLASFAATGDIQAGPFAGMHFGAEGSWGGIAPYFIGSYEHELQDTFEAMIEQGYERVIDVGCAEGYYAVGLARRMPGTEVFAFDIDPEARRLCERMAETNAVADRVHVRRQCDPKVMTKLVEPGTLVIVDCEGAELDVLRPDLTPELADADLVVEMHDFVDPTISTQLLERFAPTHEIEVIDVAPPEPADYPALAGVPEVVARLAMDEGRPVQPHPMQWAVLRAKATASKRTPS